MLNLKNCCAPEIGTVAIFWTEALAFICDGEMAVQIIGAARFVETCSVNPPELVGQIRTALVSDSAIEICGGGGDNV